MEHMYITMKLEQGRALHMEATVRYTVPDEATVLESRLVFMEAV